MMFPIYTVIYTAGVICAGPFFLFRGLGSGKYLWSLGARLGFNHVDLAAKTVPRIWVHTLSLGEAMSAAGLVERLTAAGYEVCLTTTTRSGHDIVRKMWPELPRFSYPLDLPMAVHRTIKMIEPDLFILVETDIWPNLLAGLHKQNIPAILVNGRVSARSLTRYQLLRGHWGRVLNLFGHIGCQTERDRERMLILGGRPKRVAVTGNLKYDQPAPETGPAVRADLLKETGLTDGLWLVGGSTHPGEDEILLDLYRRLHIGFPQLRLLLAPRDKNRFEAVWRLMTERGVVAARRSGERATEETRVFLLDTLGELNRFYELAEVVFVGKSLTVHGEGGGHNLVEPAARSKPVLFGPRMQNFHEIARHISESGGGRQVADAKALNAVVEELLSNEDLRRDMGCRARSVVETHRGALDRTMELVDLTLAERKSGSV